MPVLNHVRRRLVDHFATLVNELHIGSDGTVATSEDGGARTLDKITPRVEVLDDRTILVEGVFDTSYVYTTDIQEVYLQYKDPSTGEFVPVFRMDINPITKNAQTELRFSFLLEVE
mgnify:FL=1|tara:strand:+ start:10774 stop:11121 length:348 start_codon:yes stop_codon:yes gene_type:complete